MAEPTNAAPYVIWVDFEVDPLCMDEFMALLRDNAQTSLLLESGCRRFDVLVPLPLHDAVSLYEIYDNEAAFQAHLASSHYRSFAEAVAATVRRKEVRAFSLQTPKQAS